MSQAGAPGGGTSEEPMVMQKFGVDVSESMSSTGMKAVTMIYSF